jgi:hypothetical protein
VRGEPADDAVESLDGEIRAPVTSHDAREYVRVVRSRQRHGGHLAVHSLRIGGSDAAEEVAEGGSHGGGHRFICFAAHSLAASSFLSSHFANAANPICRYWDAFIFASSA